MAPGKSTFQRLYQVMRNTRIVRLEIDKELGMYIELRNMRNMMIGRFEIDTEDWIFYKKTYGPILVGAAIPLIASMFIP